MTDEKFSILSTEDLESLVDQYNAELIDQLEYNLALVYQFPDGRIGLVPTTGTKGMIFYDKNTFEEITRTNNYPIQEDYIFAREGKKIMQINENTSYYINMLSKRLDMSINQSGEEEIAEISRKVIDIGVGNIDEELTFLLGVYISEIVRNKINGKWKLEKQHHGLNPVYIPTITDSAGNTYLIWKKLSEALYSGSFARKKFNLKDCINKASVPIGHLTSKWFDVRKK